ncbi:MAG: hypothetical protein HYY40_13680 [Bacteroidetes bacterium]|nr:hypothetical protein [Bacteroidota bacterium]
MLKWPVIFTLYFLPFITGFSCCNLLAQGSASDQDVVPVTLALDQILRISVREGGNIEFVFNSMDDFKNGIGNSNFFDSQITIASSQNWVFTFGAEDANFVGSEDPANTMDLDNVGFTIEWTGTNGCCLAASDVAATTHNADDGTANGLSVFPVTLLYNGGAGNAGNITQNAFTIHWQCATVAGGGTTAMNTSTMIEEDYNPDRYVTNIFLDIDPSP